MPLPSAPFVGSQPVVLGLVATPSSSAAVNTTIQGRPISCKYRRIDANWWTAQGGAPPGGTTPGGWDTLTPTTLDRVVDAAASAGKKLVLCFTYAPPWAGGDGVTGQQFPRDGANGYRDYANALYLCAIRCEARHPGVVVAWEMWNEPNNGFLQPTSNTNYGLMIETAYKLCRTGVLLGRADRPPLPSTVEFWSGGTGAAPSVGSPNRHLNWSRSLLQRPVRCLDAISIHAYSGTCPLGTSPSTYDPATNDIPGIYNAIQACAWPGAQTMQIHDTESGYFWRDDGTPHANNAATCNNNGTRNAAEQIECDVTTAAALLTSHWQWWKTNASQYHLGMSFYYQQDTTAAANLTLSDALNHAGLYVYNANRNGAPTADINGDPAILDAFNAAQPINANIPKITFPFYLATGAITIDSDDIVAADTLGASGFRNGMIDWDAGDPTHSGVFVPRNAWDQAFNIAINRDFGLVMQFSLGNTFAGQGFNRAAVNPSGGTINVVQKFSAFVLSVIQYFSPTGPGPTITQFELFNEINGDVFDTGVESGIAPEAKAGVYMEYLARIVPAARALRPDGITIISSGIGNHASNATNRGPLDWTQDLWAASYTLGGHTYRLSTDRLFDKYGYHPYYYDVKTVPPVVNTILTPNRGWANMLEVHDWIVTQPGYCNVEFALTEAGYPISLDAAGNPDGVHTLQESANALLEMVNAWQLLSYGGASGNLFSWFNYKDGGNSVAKGKGFGALTATGGRNDPRTQMIEAICASVKKNPPPAVTCFEPKTGAVGGGDTLVLTGAFLTGSTVTVGGVACTGVTVDATGKLLGCLTPAHAQGVVPIVVDNGHGHTTAGTFQFGAATGGAPSITSVTPNSGAAADSVIIDGANLSTVTAVRFGATAATSFAVDTPTVGRITAVAPAHAAGSVTLEVDNPAGTSPHTPQDRFTYTSVTPPSAPNVISVDPSIGAPAGGTPVTIEVDTSAGVTAVAFGATPATSVAIADATHVTCVSPAGSGVVDVRVTNGAGQSGVVAADSFTYVTVPTITKLTPDSGSFTGGTTVTVKGAGFAAVDDSVPANVLFGALPCQSFTVSSDTKILAVAPASGTGAVQVTVTSPAGTSAIGAQTTFTYTSAPPTFAMVAVSLADGTVYTDMTGTLTVRGQIAFAWQATDDVGISDSWVASELGTVLADGLLGTGLWGAAFDTTSLPDGIIKVRPSGLDTDLQAPTTLAPLVTLNVANAGGGTTGHGLFARPFYTIYTIPGGVTLAPVVHIVSATPNPLTDADASETVMWSASQTGSFVVSVGNATVASGSYTAEQLVSTAIPRASFVAGNNVITVTVTNANGSGFDTVTITRGDVILPGGGLCWAAPLADTVPREEYYADPLANRLARHMRQPQQAGNVFILRSGAVVTDYCPPEDPIRVSLFGAGVGQHVSQEDANLLTAAGYGANLVACPDGTILFGFGLDPFGVSPFGGVSV